MKDNLLLKSIIDYNKSRLKAWKNGVYFEKNEEYEKILSARYMKVSRVKKHLVWMATQRHYLYFLTFTFDDELLKKCQRTKRDLIKSCMNSFSSDVLYILNIDYGKQNEREHFHALFSTDNSSNPVKHLQKCYPCRFSVQRVCIYNYSITKLSKYIDKLANHTSKDTTYNKRIVYNFKAYEQFPNPLNKLLYIQDSHTLGLC